MTNIELFHRVATHLLAQNARSVAHPGRKNSECMYRGADGLQCALGCLIPDERYTPELEGRSIASDVIVKATGLDENIYGQIMLARRLQSIHDGHEVENWATQLAVVAKHGVNVKWFTQVELDSTGLTFPQGV